MLKIFRSKNQMSHFSTNYIIVLITILLGLGSAYGGSQSSDKKADHIPKSEQSQQNDQFRRDRFTVFNETIWKGRWNHLMGALKEKWGKFTDDDLLELEGNQQKLNGLVQKRYGLEEDEAKRQVEEFYRDAANDLKIDKKDVNMFLTINNNIWKGHWHSIKGKIKERWGKLTDNELLELEGNQEKLEGLVQKKYGINQERAKREVDEFYNDLAKSLHKK